MPKKSSNTMNNIYHSGKGRPSVLAIESIIEVVLNHPVVDQGLHGRWGTHQPWLCGRWSWCGQVGVYSWSRYEYAKWFAAGRVQQNNRENFGCKKKTSGKKKLKSPGCDWLADPYMVLSFKLSVLSKMEGFQAYKYRPYMMLRPDEKM